MPGDVSLKGIEFEIKGKSDAASSSIDKLIGKLGALQKALSATSGIQKLSSGLKGLQEAMQNLKNADIKGASEALTEFGKTAKSLEGLAAMSKDLSTFAKSMVKLAENPEGILNVAEALNTLGSVDLTNLVQAQEAMRAFADAMKAVNSGGGRGAPQEKQISLWHRLAEGVRSVAKAGAQGAFQLLAKPFRDGLGDVARFAKSIGGVASQFKRIAGYRIIRSIIREITQGFSEGIKNLYGWSTLVGGKFAASMNQITTSMTYFKNSLGAAVAPIINALAPAIDFLIDKVVALINIINQLFARLTGAATWTRAIKKAQEYDDAIAGAGGSAKEALRYLAPFDELNRLPSDKARGGGGSNQTDYSGMFEDVSVFSEGISNFADNIRAAVENGDWQGVGKLIGEKVNGIIDSINFSAIGTKVGEKINALFTTKYWTLKSINFQNIGKKIAEFFTGQGDKPGVLDAIDFETVGRSFAQKFTILPDLIIGVVTNLQWDDVGKSIGSFVQGVSDEFGEWLDGIDWENAGQTLIEGIISMLDNLATAETAASVASFLNSAWNAAKGLLEGIWKAVFGNGVIQSDLSVELSATQLKIDNGGVIDLSAGDKLSDALTALSGGVIGFALGGVHGALVGATIAVSVAALINALEFPDSGVQIGESELAKKIRDVLMTIAGGIVGFTIAGVPGALIGMTVGTIISLAVNEMKFEDGLANASKEELEEAKKALQEKIDILPAGTGSTLTKAFYQQRIDDIDHALSTLGTGSAWQTGDGYSGSGGKFGSDMGEEAGISFLDTFIKALASPFAITAGGSVKVPLEVTEPEEQNLTQTLEEITDHIKERFKEKPAPMDVVGELTSTKSKLTPAQRTIPAFAEYLSVKSKLTAGQRTIPTFANFESSNDRLNEAQRTFSSTAAFNVSKNGSKWNADSTTWSATAAFDKSVNGAKWSAASTTWDATAAFNKSVNGTKWNADSTTWSATAAFNTSKNGSNWTAADTTWNATAQFTKSVNGANWTSAMTTWNSTANFNKVTADAALQDNAGNMVVSAKLKVIGQSGTPTIEAKISPNVNVAEYKAGGGVFSGGAWRDIPQYAGGTTRAGSIFIAGEAGPEIVGHIGGRTEVLNKSQMAATMYSAVRSALHGLRMSVSAPSVASANDGGVSEETMYRAFSRALADSDLGGDINLDGDVLYSSMVRRNRQNTRLTGVNAMA